MKRRRKAFISYRRADAYDAEGFSGRVRDALLKLGFDEVFLDTGTIKPGENYEARIHRAITECDLFIALVGPDWLKLLQQRIDAKKDDIVSREIRAAMRYEKKIVPLIIDDAAWPAREELPSAIGGFHLLNAKPMRSSASVDDVKSAINSDAIEILKKRVITTGPLWMSFYLLASFAAYWTCAIATNWAGVSEFGFETWLSLGTRWSAFFVWPIIFLPFAMLALERPMRILFNGILNARSIRDAATYLTPVALALMVTVMASVLEIVSEYQAPWTVHPIFANGASDCGSPPTTPQGSPIFTDPSLAVVEQYDATGVAAKNDDLKGEHWLESKCWPGAFFYLISPKISQGKLAPTDERAAVQKAFRRVLVSKTLDVNHVPLARMFNSYVASFVVLIFLGSLGVSMSLFFVVASLRNEREDWMQKLPSEDAYLCLTYAFVSLMFWVPFRMVTNYVKQQYFCADLANCPIDVSVYFNDFLIGGIFTFGYLCMAAGLMMKHRRLGLGFLGGMTIAAIVFLSWGVLQYGGVIADLAGSWRFYLAVGMCSMLILSLLWYQFDPSIVRFNDFRREMRNLGSDA